MPKRQRTAALQDASRNTKTHEHPTGLGVRQSSAAFEHPEAFVGRRILAPFQHLAFSISLLPPLYLPACDSDFPRRKPCNHLWIEAVLGFLNAGVQCLSGIAAQHGNCFLRYDRSRINSLIYKMHCAARYLHAIIQRLLPGFQPRKCRQQRRMNIDHASGERP